VIFEDISLEDFVLLLPLTQCSKFCESRPIKCSEILVFYGFFLIQINDILILLTFHMLFISMNMHFRINLDSTPDVLDRKVKHYCLNSMIRAPPRPYQNHPLWYCLLDQTNHIQKTRPLAHWHLLLLRCTQ
jgi:hypothetical protein